MRKKIGPIINQSQNIPTDNSWPDEFNEHPGRIMFLNYVDAWIKLDAVDQAIHKLANSPTWHNYQDAIQYGIHIHNVRLTEEELA